MTLANMHRHGVRSLAVACDGAQHDPGQSWAARAAGIGRSCGAARSLRARRGKWPVHRTRGRERLHRWVAVIRPRIDLASLLRCDNEGSRSDEKLSARTTSLCATREDPCTKLHIRPRQFGRKLDCHARHSSPWECRLIKELSHVSTSSFSYRCGGEPDLRWGACAIHRACAKPEPDSPGLTGTFHRDQGGKLDQEAMECGQAEMVPGQGEMERLQPGHRKKLSGRKSWSYLYDCMTKA
jgi:hypothetical protein